MVPRRGRMRGRDCLKHTDREPHQLPSWSQWSYRHASKPWRCLGWDSKRCPAESLEMEDSLVPLEKTVSQCSSTGAVLPHTGMMLGEGLCPQEVTGSCSKEYLWAATIRQVGTRYFTVLYKAVYLSSAGGAEG